MCSQPVISLETKKIQRIVGSFLPWCTVCIGCVLCILCVIICTLRTLVWLLNCGAAPRLLWNPWLAGDVGIRGEIRAVITQRLRSNDLNCLLILSAALHWIPIVALI